MHLCLYMYLYLYFYHQVSEEAPTFATDSKFGDLLVVVVPRQGPRIVGAHERFLLIMIMMIMISIKLIILIIIKRICSHENVHSMSSRS